MTAIYKREITSHYGTMLGWAVGAVLLGFEGLFLWYVNFTGGYAQLHYSLSYLAMVLLPAVPAITMQSFAGEKRQKTDLLLFSLPLSSYGVVLGKFLAALTVVLLPELVMGTYPLFLSSFGPIPMLSWYSGLIGFFFLAAAAAALGLWISSLVENPALAAALSLGTLLLLYFLEPLALYLPTGAGATLVLFLLLGLLLGLAAWLFSRSWLLAGFTAGLSCFAVLLFYAFRQEAFQGLLPRLMRALSPFSRYAGSFMVGLFDWGTLIYDLSFATVFLHLTRENLEKRRWNA